MTGTAYSDGGAAPAADKSLQDTQRLMMREVAHSIISNSMCHFHSCSQTMGFQAWQEFLKKWTDHSIKLNAAFPHKFASELHKDGHFFDKLLIGLLKQ